MDSTELRLAATLQTPPPGGAPSAAPPVPAPVPQSATPRSRSIARAVGQALGLVALGVIVLFLLSLTVGPLLLPYKALTVYSGSMEPTIHTGSVAIDVPIAAQDVKVGDVITFVRPDNQNELVTHRVIQIETGPSGRQWVTRGDANSVADPWRVAATGAGYKFVFGIPYVGFVLVWLQSPIGRLLFLVIPAAALGLLTLYELWWPRRARSGA
jgi:signal peptidase I